MGRWLVGVEVRMVRMGGLSLIRMVVLLAASVVPIVIERRLDRWNSITGLAGYRIPPLLLILDHAI